MNEKVKEGLMLHRMIVKLGTANLCNQFGQLDQDIFNDFARQVVKLQNQGMEVIIVSSGAIRAGEERMKNLGINTVHLGKKELAGIGARHLLNRWGNAFGNFGKEVSQVWVTFGNWANEGERQSIKSSLLNYLKAVVVPVVNELDVVSDWEIIWMEKRISENDRLARMVALLVGVNAVLFLTDEGGIYEEDPKKNSQARLYEEISARAKPELIGISGTTSKVGTGGMLTKWKEASWLSKKGIRVAIAGREDDVILKFARGESVGTRIGTVTRFK